MLSLIFVAVFIQLSLAGKNPILGKGKGLLFLHQNIIFVILSISIVILIKLYNMLSYYIRNSLWARPTDIVYKCIMESFPLCVRLILMAYSIALIYFPTFVFHLQSTSFFVLFFSEVFIYCFSSFCILWRHR